MGFSVYVSRSLRRRAKPSSYRGRTSSTWFTAPVQPCGIGPGWSNSGLSRRLMPTRGWHHGWPGLVQLRGCSGNTARGSVRARVLCQRARVLCQRVAQNYPLSGFGLRREKELCATVSEGVGWHRTPPSAARAAEPTPPSLFPRLGPGRPQGLPYRCRIAKMVCSQFGSAERTGGTSPDSACRTLTLGSRESEFRNQ